MKALKYIAQVLAGIAYTVLATWLFCWLMNLLTRWMFNLSVGWMIVLLIVCIGAIWLLVIRISCIESIPYYYTNGENIVAVVLSVLLTVVQVVFGIWSIWNLPHNNEFVPIVSLIITTELLLVFGGTFVTMQIGAYDIQ